MSMPAALVSASKPVEVDICTTTGAWDQPTVSASSAVSDAGSFANTAIRSNTRSICQRGINQREAWIVTKRLTYAERAACCRKHCEDVSCTGPACNTRPPRGRGPRRSTPSAPAMHDGTPPCPPPMRPCRAPRTAVARTPPRCQRPTATRA